jgi:hypothetical protein
MCHYCDERDAELNAWRNKLADAREAENAREESANNWEEPDAEYEIRTR